LQAKEGLPSASASKRVGRNNVPEYLDTRGMRSDSRLQLYCSVSDENAGASACRTARQRARNNLSLQKFDRQHGM